MGQAVTILCHGDSLTQGCNGSRPDYPYSREIPGCVTREVEITNEGYPGFGVVDLKDCLEKSLNKKSQDIVCVMGGTNNLFMTPAAEILVTLKETWRMCLEKGCRVVALTILEAQIGPDFHDNQVELNRLIRKAVAQEQNSKLTMFDACGAIPTQETRPDLWCDQVHPTMEGYKILGQGIGIYLEKLLKSLDAPETRRKTMFRPCIDIHSGVVKQIVGGTLSDDTSQQSSLQTNWVSEQPASFYAGLYKEHNLEGGHVIMLGPNCTEAAETALSAWPGKLQVGGGINETNAKGWLEAGAEKVILTSWLFPDGQFSMKRLSVISDLITPERLVIDLSCRANKGKSGWTVAMNKWQTLTTLEISNDSLDMLRDHCSEFLVHAADIEGLQNGIDEHLVEYLGLWAQKQQPGFRVTYAGGARSKADLELVDRLSGGHVDLTIGSALDIFGGSGATLEECILFNLRE